MAGDDVDTMKGSRSQSPPQSFSVEQHSESPRCTSVSALSSARVAAKEISISQGAAIESRIPQSKEKLSLMLRINFASGRMLVFYLG